LESLKRNVHNKELSQKLLGFYRDAKRLEIHAEHSSVTSLPRAKREEIYARVRHSAEEQTIELFICACKNPDVAHGTCNIGGTWPRWPVHETQRKLFDQGD
jgi:hypothetical protein